MTLHLTRRGAAAWARIDRPGRGGSLDPGTVDELRRLRTLLAKLIDEG